MRKMNLASVFYLCCIELIALTIFLVSFFPLKPSSGKISEFNSLPEKLSVSRLDKERFYSPQVERFVIMVIDAMRYDFIDGPLGSQYMPFTTKMIKDQNVCLINAKTHPPTVTMPRIKAMITGTIPNFVDIILNFGSVYLKEDNIVHQAERNGLKAVFYGDETWLKLLPTSFIRHKTTTSFFVADYTEVDSNVTEMALKELENVDWNVMILHYLGLDHIGHLEGPRSPLVGPKLKEMDDMIGKIYQSLQDFELQKSRRTAFLVCADHGMKDSGSHGGTSPAEIYVPVLLFNHGCPRYEGFIEINQVDLVPYMSLLLGLPIPADSVGRLDNRLLNHIDSRSVVYALHYNVQRLWDLLHENQGEVAYENDGYKFFMDGMKYFDSWVQSNFQNDMHKTSISHYISAQQKFSEDLISDSINLDLYALSVSLIILSQVVLIIISGGKLTLDHISYIACLFCLFFGANHGICYFWQHKSLFCSQSSVEQAFVGFVSAIISINTVHLVQYSSKFQKPNLGNTFFLFGTVLHCLSSFSTSFIEEEHQFWYFIVMTFFTTLLHSHSKIIIVSMITLRVIRTLNQTGDKWAFLPDLGDWLNDHNSVLIPLYIAGLICLQIICIRNPMKFPVGKFSWRLFVCTNGAQLICIGLYKITTKFNVIPPISYIMNSENIEVNLFWSLMVIKGLALLPHLMHLNGNILSGFVLNVFLVAVSLLLRPYNIILLPLICLSSNFLVQISGRNVEKLITLHYWLGMIFYFLQGNSNSFASIDIAAGYIGLSTYNALITGSYIFFHTFAAPILSYMLLVKQLINQNKFISKRVAVYRVIMLLICTNVLVFTISTTVHRHHLFIWTVFAPKLLYIGVQILLCIILLFISEVIIQIDLLYKYK